MNNSGKLLLALAVIGGAIYFLTRKSEDTPIPPPPPPEQMYSSFAPSNAGSYYTNVSQSNNWWAQSFTPTVSHKVTKLALLLRKNGSPDTLTVSLKEYLNGTDLCSGTINGNTLPAATEAMAWTNISMGTGCILTPNRPYIIVIRMTGSGLQIDRKSVV